MGYILQGNCWHACNNRGSFLCMCYYIDPLHLEVSVRSWSHRLGVFLGVKLVEMNTCPLPSSTSLCLQRVHLLNHPFHYTSLPTACECTGCRLSDCCPARMQVINECWFARTQRMSNKWNVSTVICLPFIFSWFRLDSNIIIIRVVHLLACGGMERNVK